jgi:hypothetical protein
VDGGSDGGNEARFAAYVEQLGTALGHADRREPLHDYCLGGFLLPVRALFRLFRRLFLAGLADAHMAGRLTFFGDIEGLGRRQACTAHLAPLQKKKWFVYAKPPFAGPEAVLAYLARYTHRVAIANSRLISLDTSGPSQILPVSPGRLRPVWRRDRPNPYDAKISPSRRIELSTCSCGSPGHWQRIMK